MRTRGKVFWLQVPPATVITRLKADPLEAQRPPLTGKSITDEITEIMQQREPLYMDAAHHTVDATASVENIVRNVQELLESAGEMSLCNITR